MIKVYEFESGEEVIANAVYEECMDEHDLAKYDIDIDITMVSAEEIRELNNANRGIDNPTDVLSFPFVDIAFPFDKSQYKDDINHETGAVYLGEIIICREIMLEQAKEYGHSAIRECAYLITHGILHLLGYDHTEPEDKAVMREKEEEVLDKLNYLRFSE